MFINKRLCSAQSASVNKARVVQRIRKDGIPLLHDARKDTEICQVAATENEGTVGLFPIGNLFFQLFMKKRIACRQPRTSRTCPKNLNRFDRFLFQSSVRR